jgi:SAM-dependent methyltransferase
MIATAPPDARVLALLAAGGLGDVFHPAQHRACLLVERYVSERVLDVAAVLGLEDALNAGTSPDALAAPDRRDAVAWLCRRLATDGHLVADGDRWRLAAPLPTSIADAVRADALAEMPDYAPAYDLVDAAAAAYPRVVRGETTGEEALLARLALWLAYFSNRHGYYALNNHVAARAAASRIGAGARVLEVGAGLGSATEVLLARCDGGAALAAYAVTEPQPFFRRRAQRTLTADFPAAPLAFGDLDLNQPWATQDVAPGSLSLIFGVNVFHLAVDLDAVLAEAHAALAPGGWLVVGEGMRPAPGVPVGAELPFQLLSAWRAVRLDPVTRPEPGFLTAAQWTSALERAGFRDVVLEPDAAALVALQPNFYAAAVCGRRG